MTNSPTPLSFTVLKRFSAGLALALVASVFGALAIPVVAGATTGVPSAPLSTGTVYVQGARMVQVTWKAPTSDTPAGQYEAVSVPGSLTCTTTALKCDIGGLVVGTTYTFYVTASNSYGTGPRSASSGQVTITQLPGGVSRLTTSYTPGTTALTANWNAPTTGYPVPSSYKVTLSGTNGPSATVSTHTYTFSSLVPGQSYTITVTPINAVGAGAPTVSAPVTIDQYPGAPSGVTANLTTGERVVVSWVAPVAGYPRPSLYTVVSSPGGLKCTSTKTSCVVNQLSLNTTYTFSVTATNVMGTGAAGVSNAVTIRPPLDRPGAPTFRTPKANVRQVSLSWKTSRDCGAGCVYSVLVNGTRIANTHYLRLVVTHLVPDVSYTFRVSASSSRGMSFVSGPSKVVRVWLTVLNPVTVLKPGHFLYSPNRTYRLAITSGGHLTCQSRAGVAWTTSGSGGTLFGITTTGNAELTTGTNSVVWESGTSFAGSSLISLSNSGSLEIINGRRVIWESNGGSAAGLKTGPASGRPTATVPTATIP